MNQKQGVWMESDPVLRRLSGRVDYLLMRGRVKDPELMQSAYEVLSELVDACECLLNDMGEPDDGCEANLMQRCRDVIAKAKGQQ